MVTSSPSTSKAEKKVNDAVHSVNTDELSALYERDYFAWIETTIEQLQSRDYKGVDWNNLVEEIADIGRSQKHSLESNLVVVLLHLLKWQYQPDRRSRSWKSSIAEHRRRIRKLLKKSPSLKPFVSEELPEAYTDGVKQASIETGIAMKTFPEACPYSLTQVLDEDFLPE